MGNDELFQLYDKDLILRLHNAKNLSDTRKILAQFKDHLGDCEPSTPKPSRKFAEWLMS